MDRTKKPLIEEVKSINKGLNVSGFPFTKETFINLHTPKQQQFLRSVKKWSMFSGGRRCGKTVASASLAIICDTFVLEPFCKGKSNLHYRIPILSATADKVKKLYWKLFDALNETYSLGYKFSTGDNTIYLRNSHVNFHGLRDITNASIDLGFSYPLIIIDEPQSIRESVLKYYLDNIGSYGTFDAPMFKISFAMNPPVTYNDTLFKLKDNKELDFISASTYDNTALPKEHIDATALSLAKKAGYESIAEAKEKDTAFQRNVYGMWSLDNTMLIFNQKKVGFYEPEDLDRTSDSILRVIGVDYGGGGTGKDAIVCLCWDMYENKIFLDFEEEYESKINLRNLSKRIEYVAKGYDYKWGYNSRDPEAIVVDAGSFGKRLTQEIMDRYTGQPLIPAKKGEKGAFLAVLKAEIEEKRLVLRPDSSFYKEMNQLIWNERRDDYDDKAGIHTDLGDACLYALKYIHAHMPQRKPESISYEKRMKQELVKKIEEENPKTLY